MTIKTLIYTIPLPEEMFDACVSDFASATGWKLPAVEPEGYDEEADKLEHNRKKLNEYVNNTIVSYQAITAADAARKSTIEQGQAALGQITTILVVE